MIGYFDGDNFPNVHGKIATGYFVFAGLYVMLLTRIMNKNRSAFPEEKHAKIDKMIIVNRVLWITMLMQTMGGILPGWVRHLAEWASALLLVNYFALVSDFDEYYDTVTVLQSNLMQRAFSVKA